MQKISDCISHVQVRTQHYAEPSLSQVLKIAAGIGALAAGVFVLTRGVPSSLKTPSTLGTLFKVKTGQQSLIRFEQKIDVAHCTRLAEQFANKPCASPKNLLLPYIVKILENPEFQKDPEAYLSSWKKQRGSTEELLIPEDDARRFFETLSPWAKGK